MTLQILLLLLIGLGSTSAQVPHCVPCAEPFQQFDYQNVCDELQNSTNFIEENEEPHIVRVFDIQKQVSDRSVALCLPCSETFTDFEAKCESFKGYIESESIEYTNTCNQTNHEVFFEGQCQILLEQGTCPDYHWLVINNITTGPVCEYNRCNESTSLSVNYEGLCLNLSSEDGYKCDEDKDLVVFPSGTAFCECYDDKTVKLPNTRECLTTRQKTSQCSPNWVLEKSFDGNPVCVRNFCSDDEIYLHGRCWTLPLYCRLGDIIIFEPKSNYFNEPKDTITCIPNPQSISLESSILSHSQNARPIANCPRNAARRDGKCPIFSMRKKLPFE